MSVRRLAVGGGLVAALMPLLLCFGLSGFIAIVQLDPVLLVQSPLPYVELCVGVETRPGLGTGLAWTDWDFSGQHLHVATMSHHTCGLVPWVSFLPRRGGVVLPSP